ncbi:HAUS augmin-like complex subunit 6 N-terminus-domain-containing protein [Durotheca rogersii]|uniref:HAUS augmin-like complex subunit 6 N-terminus-domain-containing protein n=1 Tax=Durotheca rogersii TaxID=419775 RepID=UPI00221E907A|nr:HAUS augmin-like complex subunit 6 N-terminus-domain-containing protein [Durotheca rogersii]KAI5861960.1 HAUS augmin-like complex subunit 6 N-terminus-domain-containing protein [Durotheca rogersii]
MSLYQANPPVTRTRSLRAPSKSSLTAPPLALSAAAAAQIPCSTSNLALFLTNLRLLDLDLEPDWPGITPATFSAKDAAGGQRKRIQSVEWALYQLFTLWDYNETQNKLRPFFPPLDQVQSVNLRSALVRSLEQAKKNGVLGRDAIVRKTMLDECKGERLEEVLAVFSSAVLKKLVAERALNSGPEYRPTISERLSLENWGYSGDRTQLNALLLAHKVSLTCSLRRKDAARAKYREFEDLLASKERAIAQRREQIKAGVGRDVTEASEKTKNEVQRIIKSNWTGNDQWIDSLLFNDTQPRKGGLFGSNFDDVWAGVEEGKITDLEEENAGLLEQLEYRVRAQKARLEKWDNFRKRMFGSTPSKPDKEADKKKAKPREAVLDFAAHQQLGLSQMDTLSPKDRLPIPAPPPEYAEILRNMQAELEAIGKPKMSNFSNILGASKRASRVAVSSSLEVHQPPAEPISDLSEWEDEPAEEELPIAKPAKPLVENRNRLAPPKSGLESRGRVPRKAYNKVAEPAVENRGPISKVSTKLEVPEPAPVPVSRVDTTPLGHKPESGQPDARTQASASYNTARSDVSRTQLPHPRKVADPMPSPERPVSPTQAMADEILASMSNASPSPTKKPRYALSLAERTRMSMSRTISHENEEDAVLPPETPAKPSHAPSHAPTPLDNLPERGEEYEDLVARTRKSMAGFEAARQKAQLERQRSEKRSKMPQRKEAGFPRTEEGVGDASIVEELLEAGEEDYEAVFKSRPRLLMSPLPSPSKRWDEDGDGDD